jgi:hypothetical protein
MSGEAEVRVVRMAMRESRDSMVVGSRLNLFG